MYRKKLSIANMRRIRADDRDVRPLGRPRVHQRLLDPRERSQALRPQQARLPRLRAGRLQQEDAASTAPSAGARTSSSSSSTSAPSAAPRRRPTASATTPTPTSPTSRRPRRRQSCATCSRRSSPRSANPVSQQCKNKINSPNRTFLGEPAAPPVPARRQELEGEVEGGHERGPDPAVLRPAVRPLGGLRATSG